MRKSLTSGFYLFVAVLLFAVTITSCNTEKKIKYFQDIPDSGVVKTIPEAVYKEPVIQGGDILNIVIETIDASSANLVNAGNLISGGSSSLPGGSGVSGILAAISGGNESQQPVSGYLVDKNGYLDIPILGKVKAAGYTTFQLKNIIYDLALKYYKDITVIVRFANLTVTVTGEVLKPGEYIMPNEKESIIDAIAMAGDLTIFGKRENVLLLRENQDGTRTAYRVNLKKSDIMSSPVYYVRQNDIIYVEPRAAKSDATDAEQAKWLTVAGAFLSVLIIVATRIK